jgi:YVTN family beta-propeller protein
MKQIAVLFSIFVLVASCKKDDKPVPPDEAPNYTNGLVVLNEGLFQQNNSSLCFYSFENNQVYTQAFFTENGRGLGDTANDFEKYTLNGTDYFIVAVDISSQLEIVEANTLKSVAQIPLFNGTTAREPRRIVVSGYAAFVCSFDGTVSVIDLTTYEVVKTIDVGANPDGMIQVGNELYVSNSGGLNFPVYDSTISVIDMTTREVIHTIDTRINCTKMIADAENEIYVLSNGNYGSVLPALVRIDAQSHTVVAETESPITSMTQGGDYIYYYDDVLKAVRKFNMLTEEFEPGILIDCISFETFSGMQFVPELNLLFCFDAKGYVNSSVIRAYNTSGIFQYEFSAELNTKKISVNE